jgi:N-acyl-D-amino-acid deacylase
VFDLKITGGTVVDGTGGERYRADIGIKDGLIVDVLRYGANDSALGSEAAETIDATGRVVAPGFVDFQTHDDG